ncbi:hypothetical protein TCON_0150 [Astathelohania contejeani]|uniref:Uncharacterized protein n=1 Tax=Astathelohania contejeani TaxID=164912 RepID=A0ABQ7I2E8_9MICR|nr:hypothetical protein TCON_0150 [Thelohania contejeani]
MNRIQKITETKALIRHIIKSIKEVPIFFKASHDKRDNTNEIIEILSMITDSTINIMNIKIKIDFMQVLEVNSKMANNFLKNYEIYKQSICDEAISFISIIIKNLGIIIDESIQHNDIINIELIPYNIPCEVIYNTMDQFSYYSREIIYQFSENISKNSYNEKRKNEFNINLDCCKTSIKNIYQDDKMEIYAELIPNRIFRKILPTRILMFYVVITSYDKEIEIISKTWKCPSANCDSNIYFISIDSVFYYIDKNLMSIHKSYDVCYKKCVRCRATIKEVFSQRKTRIKYIYKLNDSRSGFQGVAYDEIKIKHGFVIGYIKRNKKGEPYFFILNFQTINENDKVLIGKNGLDTIANLNEIAAKIWNPMKTYFKNNDLLLLLVLNVFSMNLNPISVLILTEDVNYVKRLAEHYFIRFNIKVKIKMYDEILEKGNILYLKRNSTKLVKCVDYIFILKFTGDPFNYQYSINLENGKKKENYTFSSINPIIDAEGKDMIQCIFLQMKKRFNIKSPTLLHSIMALLKSMCVIIGKKSIGIEEVETIDKLYLSDWK